MENRNMVIAGKDFAQTPPQTWSNIFLSSIWNI